MNKSSVFLSVAIFAALFGLMMVRPASSAGSLNVSLVTFATGLDNSTDIANAGDDRLFSAGQDGRIEIVLSNGTVLGTPFLDIDARVLSGGEQGLLGLAFHPDYSTNGFFYVYYTRDGTASEDGDLVISRFSVTGNPNIADPNSETILLVIDHPGQSNHNGGNLEFGPDGYLYIATGDGGGGSDPLDNAQQLDVLLGKMLRIDVDGGSPGAPDSCALSGGTYTVPSDNPFVDGAGGDCDEIWAWGLRNPWRFAFDPANGDLFIGDVGQSAWEEIDYQPAASSGGENYGWDCYEGNVLYGDPSPVVPCGPVGNYVFPIDVQPNSGPNCAITGGEVYRGGQFPELYGWYVYTDYCSGQFWALAPDGGGGWTLITLADLGQLFKSFGRGADNEIYLTDGQKIYHVVEDTVGTATSTPTVTPTTTPTGTPPTPTPTSTPTNSPTPTNTPPATSTPIGPGAPFSMELVEVAGGFTDPSVIAAWEGPELAVVERAGKVWTFDPDSAAAPVLALDISDRVDDAGFQEGLLGLVRDPDFGSNGYFYVNYTDNFSNTVVSRFNVSGPLPVDPGSEQVLFTLPQPYSDNNGGGLAFGPDGYLYVALGDGGGSGDPDQLAQDPFDLHGKILRLDVDGGGSAPDCGSGAYTIPASNPFTGGGGCGEIWQLGFRNLWGISFDSQTNDLWIADVGSQEREEINFQAAASSGGDNYGWSCYEGSQPGPNYDPGECTGPFVFPLYEYDHASGHSVTGGYVYRGAQHPAMQGYYIFADFVYGKIWSLDRLDNSVYEHYAFFAVWSALGQANDGQLYVADYGSGKIFRIEANLVYQLDLPVILRGP